MARAEHLLVEHLDELDDSRVRAQPTQGLNLPQIVHLLLALEGALHALDGSHLAVFYALGLEHLRESPLPFLRNQSIFFTDEVEWFSSQHKVNLNLINKNNFNLLCI